MKYRLFLVLAATAFISCKSKTKAPVYDTVSQKTSAGSQLNLLQQFKPFIQGVWVTSDYIVDLSRTKSPYISSKKLAGAAALAINLDSAEKDSTVVGVSLNNHEGASFTLFFKPGHQPNSLKTNWPDYEVNSNFYELGYQIAGSDTSLLLYHYNKNNHIISSVKYTRVLPKQTDKGMEYGITYITNKLLISGNYELTDTNGTTSKISFNNEGKVSGFAGYETYYVNTDFVAGPQNDLDQFSFNIGVQQQKDYLFKINKDTLNIYNIDFSADSVHLKWGELKYKLVRSK
ncbi:hypothetical protein [Mucilaginibacter celer]|uniref:Uncharacterized protein n=1 Tax=Mucilaginibacter celer TaxID=2305508 RepID=A0A494VUY1_9SPHI|nr:hypothetical protein [Mucilaginibacter celer]AYL97290.1 hypothetical protein HYN43_019125 [Mucilaginibacter celer]